MTETQELDLAFGVLDHQLVDSEGRRCGKVDDLEIEATPGDGAEVTAILAGTGYWAIRVHGPFRHIASRLGGSTVRIDWEEVGEVSSAVHLKKTTKDLRLGRGDDRARRWVEKIPGSR
jgi:sporulation protein YlmC with PRC-barrel domain